MYIEFHPCLLYFVVDIPCVHVTVPSRQGMLHLERHCTVQGGIILGVDHMIL